MEEYKIIPLVQLAVNPDQPRKHFFEDSINEMAQSIKSVGIIEPLVVRPIGDDETPVFQIVCGERRYRGACKAFIDAVPCIVRQLTDDQVFDIQITENLQRENPSPLDEAEGYQTLLTKKRSSLREIAERFGKSEDYVFGRIRLLNLVPEARAFLEEQILPVTAAMKISTLNEPQQKDAIKRTIIEVTVDNKPKKLFTGLNDLRLYFENNVLMPLSWAAFDTDSKVLCPAAGSCTDCSKRIGNSMFKEFLDSDKCLDAACYKEKHVEHYQRLQASLSKKMKVEVVFAARFYGIEREYKALGDIIAMTSYHVIENQKQRPKNALYAIFIGPDRTKGTGEGLPDHAWIEVPEKVVEKTAKKSEQKAIVKTTERDNIFNRHYTLNLFNQFKEKTIKAPNTFQYQVMASRLMAELSVPVEIIVDIAKRHKITFKAQQYNGEWSEVIINKEYTPQDDIVLSFETSDVLKAMDGLYQTQTEKMLAELIFLSTINNDELLNHISDQYKLSPKSAKKSADNIANKELKKLQTK
jgi:ParB/RepB/Spo0J family partition protein